ncbi:multicopper oxidase domain-containing protein [Amorphoplanes nipponensis]|uniref:Multicopper oxidase n=1 Tax=Actinoplanes nipponensis TaxID=135950 RepID=A0A919JQQ3_9ACTN|nr:multicopper oxidase family protein [Actinoplanes nipponensis]GIE53682.1 multicopper oxidase [Actinoplanes nipponensis]
MTMTVTTTETTAAPGATLTPFVDELPVPPVLRPMYDSHGSGVLRVRARNTTVSLHRALPRTPVWAYEGHLPGPTIEVRRDAPVRIHWINKLTGPLPFASVAGPPGSQNEPGRSGAVPRDLAGVPAWTAVHVHGAAVAAASDGWPENGVLTGDRSVSTYPNQQRATALWYHDHAMNLTAYQVYAGLAGTYLIRDDEEEALDLPSGRRELPLVLKDVNLDLDEQGRFTGRLLHKTEQGANEFFGPYTTVNGRIWPYGRFRPALHRLRMLNASNARTYRLVLLDAAGAPVTGTMWLIGTDGGLLGAPVAVPPDGLVLAPAERADVLVDLRGQAGQTLTLVNTAAAPFRGAPATAAPGTGDPANRLPFPNVMQLRVEAGPAAPATPVPATLSPTFRRLTHDDLPDDHGHRLVMLVKSSKPLREMEPAPDGPGTVRLKAADGTTAGFRMVAGTWADAATFHVTQDGWEIWRVLNLSGQMHPIHLHLVQFQILRREAYDASGFDPATGEAEPPIAHVATLPVPPEEAGWKDTVRVNPNEMAVVAARFTGHSGRYVYHCHLLEHEDAGMMRPFVVLPAGIPGMPGGHSH